MSFKLEAIFIALIVFTMVFQVGLDFYTENLSNYNVSGDTSKFGSLSNTLKGSYDAQQQDMKSKITGGTVSDSNAVDDMVKGGYTAGRVNVFAAGVTALNATNIIAKETGLIPTIYTWALGAFITISVIWGLIYLIMRFRTY